MARFDHKPDCSFAEFPYSADFVEGVAGIRVFKYKANKRTIS